MTIVIDDKTIAVFHVDAEFGNMLAGVRHLAEGWLHITIRIRMQRDDKVWDSTDDKKWWDIRTKDPLEDVLQKMRIIFENAPFRKGPVTEIHNEGDVEELMNRITSMPGMHKMEIPAKGKQH